MSVAAPIVTGAQIRRVERHLRMRGCISLSRSEIRDIALGRPMPQGFTHSYGVACEVAARALCVELVIAA